MRSETPKNPEKMTIKCVCGKEIELDLIGGQYQNTYQGECDCGREWPLEEQSESLAEILQSEEGGGKYGIERR